MKRKKAATANGTKDKSATNTKECQKCRSKMLLRYNTCPRCGHFPETRPELKINKYPHQLQELISAICGKKMISLAFSDDSKLSHYPISKNNSLINSLFKKYNLDNSCKDLYLWEVVEKMHNYRPF